MADDELENDGSGKKPLLRYLLLGAAALNFSFQDAVLLGLGLLVLAILPFFIPGFKKSAFQLNELNAYNKDNNHG